MANINWPGRSIRGGQKPNQGNDSESSGSSGVMLSDLPNTLFDERLVKPNPKMGLV